MAEKQATAARAARWRLEALGFDIFSFVVRAFPPDIVSSIGGGLFRLFGPLTRADKVARQNLALAFPDLADDARRRLLGDQWENVGRTFVELPLVDRFTVDRGRLEVVNAERLAAIAVGGRPVVFVSGHFSNWEVMAAAIVGAGIDCQVTYRAANNPFFDARIRSSRFRYGVRLFAPKGADGARELLAAMGAGQSVALLNDQKYDGGVAGLFFARTVHTNPAAARLALRFGAIIQPLSVQRAKGARFRCIVHEPIELARTGDRPANIRNGVAAINAFIEARVRERPSEWFWVHRRWPAEAYAELTRAERERDRGAAAPDPWAT